MSTVHYVMVGCWAIFLAYWLISATSAKRRQKTMGWSAGIWYPILLLFGFLFVFSFRFLSIFGIPGDPLAIRLIPPSIVIDLIVILLMVGGLIIAIVARRTLAGNWSAAVSLQKNHELVTTGLYRHVRHPIYTGVLLMVLSTTLSISTLGAWLSFFVIVIGFLLKLQQEEALLMEHFSESYVAYKSHTKRLIPFTW